VRIDTDSHTSIVLMHVVLDDLHRVRVQTFAPGDAVPPQDVEAMLLIGDKVVNDAPSDDDFPHQLDLGECWKKMTGLPFVFAVWMTQRDTSLGDLPSILAAQRRDNAGRIDAIVERHAASHGWTDELAHRYLGTLLKYEIGPPELEAMQRFWKRAHALGCINDLRPLDLYPVDQPVG